MSVRKADSDPVVVAQIDSEDVAEEDTLLLADSDCVAVSDGDATLDAEGDMLAFLENEGTREGLALGVSLCTNDCVADAHSVRELPGEMLTAERDAACDTVAVTHSDNVAVVEGDTSPLADVVGSSVPFCVGASVEEPEMDSVCKGDDVAEGHSEAQLDSELVKE